MGDWYRTLPLQQMTLDQRRLDLGQTADTAALSSPGFPCCDTPQPIFMEASSALRRLSDMRFCAFLLAPAITFLRTYPCKPIATVCRKFRLSITWSRAGSPKLLAAGQKILHFDEQTADGAAQ